MKLYRVNLAGSYYEDMVGKLVSEKPYTVVLNFGAALGTVIFLKKYLVEETIV